MVSFASRSMSTGDIDNQQKAIYYKISELQTALDNATQYSCNLRTPLHILEEYTRLQQNFDMFSNKRKKEVERAIKQLEVDHKFLKQDLLSYQKINEKEIDSRFFVYLFVDICHNKQNSNDTRTSGFIAFTERSSGRDR